jgi:heptaprenyl diphosphate synthase
MTSKERTRHIVIISMLAASGLILFVFESFLPVLPWFRPGFGNVATILALMLFGFNDALKVTMLRVVLGALILGRLFTPLFAFAIGGGLASVIIMAAAMRLRIFGPVGVSVLGAVAHNLTQLAIAYFIFIHSGDLAFFIPLLIVTGVATGILTGLVSAGVVERGGSRLRFVHG